MIEWVWSAILLLQLISGTTLGPDLFRGLSSDLPVTTGRIARIIRRHEEPVHYWTMVGLYFIMLLCFAGLKRVHGAQGQPRDHHPSHATLLSAFLTL